jgi:hypothetical protein
VAGQPRTLGLKRTPLPGSSRIVASSGKSQRGCAPRPGRLGGASDSAGARRKDRFSGRQDAVMTTRHLWRPAAGRRKACYPGSRQKAADCPAACWAGSREERHCRPEATGCREKTIEVPIRIVRPPSDADRSPFASAGGLFRTGRSGLPSRRLVEGALRCGRSRSRMPRRTSDGRRGPRPGPAETVSPVGVRTRERRGRASILQRRLCCWNRIRRCGEHSPSGCGLAGMRAPCRAYVKHCIARRMRKRRS